MKGIEKLECILKDSKGKLVSLGDEIIIILPEIDETITGSDDEEYGHYLSQKTIRAKLGLRLSSGLYVTILEIIERGDPDDDSCLTVGQVMNFKRFAWEWYLK